MRLNVSFLSLCLFALSVYFPAHGAISFKIECDNPVMDIDEQRTLTIYAYGNELVEDYGLYSWSLDLIANSSDGGSVEVVSASVLAPKPNFIEGYKDINVPIGSVNWLGAAVLSETQVSNVGVGGYTSVAEIVIKGISAGTVIYDIGDYGGGFYGAVRNGSEQITGTFDANNSTTSFTVVPEPTSLLLLTGLSLIAVKYRNKK